MSVTLELGLVIPDTVEELQGCCEGLHTVDLVGDTTGWFRVKERGVTLTTWPVGTLPATLVWDVDVWCEVHGARYDGGPTLPLDSGSFHAMPGDKVVLEFRA